MCRFIRSGSIAAIALLFLSLCGCSKNHFFEVSGTVRNASNGEPIPFVTVTLNAGGEQVPPEHSKRVFRCTTNSDGEFQIPKFALYSVSNDHANQCVWYLKFEKPGYHPEVVEIKMKNPAEYGQTTFITTAVCLRRN